MTWTTQIEDVAPMPTDIKRKPVAAANGPCDHKASLIVEQGTGAIHCGTCKVEVSLDVANEIFDEWERNAPGLGWKHGKC